MKTIGTLSKLYQYAYETELVQLFIISYPTQIYCIGIRGSALGPEGPFKSIETVFDIVISFVKNMNQPKAPSVVRKKNHTI